MVFFKQRFKIGDTVYIKKPTSSYKSDESDRWVKGTISYAHPAFGWCNVVVKGVTYGVWSNEILQESEYCAQREKIKAGELAHIHIRSASDGALSY